MRLNVFLCCCERIKQTDAILFFFLKSKWDSIEKTISKDKNSNKISWLTTKWPLTNVQQPTDTNKLWQLIAAIVQLQKPVWSHQGENYPFLVDKKKCPTSLLELNFIEILHLMTQTRKDDQTNWRDKKHAHTLNTLENWIF